MTSLADALAASAQALLVAADDLNRLDAAAGDGDLGVTMSTAARVVMDVIGAEETSAADLLRKCGVGISQQAPSTAGTLVATGLLRASAALSRPDYAAGAAGLGQALSAAAAGISDRGKANAGDKTMLDALIPAAEMATRQAAAGADLPQVLLAAAEAADQGARATAAMRPRHGRAGWLAERSQGHEDGGARVVAIALASAAAALLEGEAAS